MTEIEANRMSTKMPHIEIVPRIQKKIARIPSNKHQCSTQILSNRKIHNAQFLPISWAWLMLALPLLLMHCLRYAVAVEATLNKFSAPLTDTNDTADEDSFRPFIPKDLSPEYISRNVFTASGHYRVFQTMDSDLRSPVHRERNNDVVMQQSQRFEGTLKKNMTSMSDAAEPRPTSTNEITTTLEKKVKPKEPLDGEKGLEALLGEYVEQFFGEGLYEPSVQLVEALQQQNIQQQQQQHQIRNDSITDGHKRHLRETVPFDSGNVQFSLPRAMSTGRLLFFAGLKKIMWPLYMGLQILKSLLFAMFLPTIIGSVGKLLGKGIISGSSPLFIRPNEEPQDLDFKDNHFNFDDDSKFELADDGHMKDPGYSYQPAASQIQQQYAYNAAQINQESLSRYGMTEQQKMQDSYLSALQSLSSASFKNSNSISGGSFGGGPGGIAGSLRNKPVPAANMNTFQTFQKVPTSSLLLSNYDPFYSPLLSRLDSVFAQLKLNSENEDCREKLICLMYANPAKYAPYSNLVSAQLSRELNELRKPTSDNPDILRFFKYMRAAKDGQDGVECEKTFDKCEEFKDFENPAMVSTYHDINKLVQARKLT